MLINFILLILVLGLLIQSANWAVCYATRLAESLRISKYIMGFFIVAVISILPEAFIAITSAIEGVPTFGLGTLLGANITDLTLVFGLVVLSAGRNLKIESRIIKNRFLYISIISLTVIFGLNGHYSRLEGAALLIAGLFFYFYILKNNIHRVKAAKEKFKIANLWLLLISMCLLLLAAHWTVALGIGLANVLQINHVLIGMFVVALGTTLPELFFSIKAARRRHDGLAVGDLLGTVIADATIVVGILALIRPFEFSPRIMYVSGFFLLTAVVVLFYMMKTGRSLSRKEAMLLIFFYLIFVAAQLLIN